MASNAELWSRLPGLVWSNQEASDQVRLARALLQPRFFELLEIVMALGLDAVEREWAALETEGGSEVERARPIVHRVLRNLREGLARAASGN
jgi:hypothetical protein